jgi:branched-subunit amino acid aminotransferase/4-amino-4-deoxychorismate lyase
MRVRDGHIEFWADHKRRLSNSLELGVELCQQIEAVARPLSLAALRLEVKSDQSLEILKRDLSLNLDPTPVKLKLIELEFPRLKGLEVKLSDYGVVLNDLEKIRAEGLDDLVYAVNKTVLEASFSNLFIITSDDQLIAPKATLGILEGIYLKNFLLAALDLGRKVSRQTITVDQLLQAKMIGLSNCLRGIRLAVLEEKSYDDGEFFYQVIQPIVEHMHEKDRR